jgi:hypothetical protein
MKSILFLFFGLLLLSSCTDIDDVKDENLYGQWKLVEVKYFSNNGSNTITQITLDYTKEFVYYSFEPNDTVVVTGFDTIAYTSGDYSYTYKSDKLTEDDDATNVLLVEIDGTKWEYSMHNGTMSLSRNFVNGPTLIFKRSY